MNGVELGHGMGWDFSNKDFELQEVSMNGVELGHGMGWDFSNKDLSCKRLV
jgi:hypothetical protein